MLGLVLSTEHLERVIDRGPSAQEEMLERVSLVERSRDGQVWVKSTLPQWKVENRNRFLFIGLPRVTGF